MTSIPVRDRGWKNPSRTIFGSNTNIIEQDFRVKSNYVTEITQLKLVVVCTNVLALKGYKDKVHQDFDVGM